MKTWPRLAKTVMAYQSRHYSHVTSPAVTGEMQSNKIGRLAWVRKLNVVSCNRRVCKKFLYAYGAGQVLFHSWWDYRIIGWSDVIWITCDLEWKVRQPWWITRERIPSWTIRYSYSSTSLAVNQYRNSWDSRDWPRTAPILILLPQMSTLDPLNLLRSPLLDTRVEKSSARD